MKQENALDKITELFALEFRMSLSLYLFDKQHYERSFFYW